MGLLYKYMGFSLNFWKLYKVIICSKIFLSDKIGGGDINVYLYICYIDLYICYICIYKNK